MTSGGIIFINRKSTYYEFFPMTQPLFWLRKDYFHQNNIDLNVEIIHFIQAIWRHWSREPITTLSRLSMFMSRFIRTDYHAGQIFIPHRIKLQQQPLFKIIANTVFIMAAGFTPGCPYRPVHFKNLSFYAFKLKIQNFLFLGFLPFHVKFLFSQVKICKYIWIYWKLLLFCRGLSSQSTF